MPRTFRPPFPNAAGQIESLGQRLRLARLRRRFTTVLFAARMGVSRDTLNRLEKGDPNIALGTYLRAMRVLGLDKDFDALAQDDVLGRKLQDIASMSPARAPRAKKGPETENESVTADDTQTCPIHQDTHS